jgi:hypothetical protein
MPKIQRNKVITTRQEVYAFNSAWPCSKLDSKRHYWFEFDETGDLVDCDVPEHSDGPEAAAMADDCKALLFDDVRAPWMAEA